MASVLKLLKRALKVDNMLCITIFQVFLGRWGAHEVGWEGLAS